MSKHLKLILFILLPVGFFLLIAFQWRVWNEEFRTEDGGLGTARFTDISWRYWGSPHVLSVGGGAISCSVTFSIDGHLAKWKSTRDERVFAVQFNQHQWYAITLDRTNVPKSVIRFYRGKDGDMLMEIEPRDYPIRLAIENLWLKDTDEEIYSAFTSGDAFARSSLLATTWWKIVHSEDVEEVKPGFIEEIAAREFPGRKNFLPR
jgi:hypothetical protein